MRPFCFVLIFSFASIDAPQSHAQPPSHSETVQNPPSRKQPVRAAHWGEADIRASQIRRSAEKGPAQIVAQFLRYVKVRHWSRAALCVAGVDTVSPEIQQIAMLTQDLHTDSAFETDADAVEQEDNRVGKTLYDTVEITFPLISRDDLGIELRRDETVTLRREKLTWLKGPTYEAGSAAIWRIVAPELKSPDATNRERTEEQKPPTLGVIASYAQLFAYPKFGVSKLGSQRAIQKGQQLAIGMLQFVQDNDEKFDVTVENVGDQLLPYLGDFANFTAPGDALGTQSFQLNPALAGKRVADVDNPAQTVLFYLGKDAKPEFRYGGMTPIVYVDGHVKMVSPEALRWEP
ncbi:MAG TPA: hypothetical protein VF681_01570 [Abditibacteriaceae bacterium]